MILKEIKMEEDDKDEDDDVNDEAAKVKRGNLKLDFRSEEVKYEFVCDLR